MYVFTLGNSIIFRVDADTVDQAIDLFCEKFKRYHRVGLYCHDVVIVWSGLGVHQGIVLDVLGVNSHD